MTWKRFAPWIAMALMLVVAVLLTMVTTEHPLVGQAAPPVKLPLLADASAGASVPREARVERGRVVVLDFWASWCPPCKASIPILNRVRERLKGQPVDFFGVNVETNQPPSFVRSAHARLGARFPTTHDADGRVQGTYQIDRLPTLIVIDKHGIVRFAGFGVPGEDRLVETIQSLVR